MIPKIIHYCWLSDDPVPDSLKNCMETWRDKLQGYEFIKWDFSRFNKEDSVWVKEAFNNKKYAFACDYIRLFALYNYGGIYMDMDIEVLRPFDDLLNDSYMMARERPDRGWIEAGCFGVEKNNGFIKKCLNYYEGRHFVDCDGVFDDKPLPQIMFNVYKENKYDFPLGDWQKFTCKSYETGRVRYSSTSYTIHHFAGSWKNENEKKINKRAIWLRENFKLVGSWLAFFYEKGNKVILVIKHGGIKELFTRIGRYINRE